MEAYLTDKSDKPGIAGMRDAWKALQPHFGALRPDQINRQTCRMYRKRRAGRSDGTIAKELRTLRAGLRWNDPRSPAVIEVPAEPPPRDRFITKAEYRRIFHAMSAPHLKVWLALAWYTAARKEAALTLTWDRVNLDTGRINLGPDVGRKGRAQVVPIARPLARILAIAKRGALTNSVVEYASGPVGDIRKGFHTAAVKAGLGDVTPHDIRRSAARQMVERGVPLHAVSQLLGHKSVDVTARVYARFSSNFLKSAVDAL